MLEASRSCLSADSCFAHCIPDASSTIFSQEDDCTGLLCMFVPIGYLPTPEQEMTLFVSFFDSFPRTIRADNWNQSRSRQESIELVSFCLHSSCFRQDAKNGEKEYCFGRWRCQFGGWLLYISHAAVESHGNTLHLLQRRGVVPWFICREV